MRYFLISLILLTSCFSKQSAPAADMSGKKEEVGSQLLVSDSDLSYEEKVKLQGDLIRNQEEQLKRQDKEIQHYQRQDYYNKALEKYTK